MSVSRSRHSWVGDCESHNPAPATRPVSASISPDHQRRPSTSKDPEAIANLLNVVQVGPQSPLQHDITMATKRDMRRPDLSESMDAPRAAPPPRHLANATSTVIPYQEPKVKDNSEFSSTLSSTLPMAVMLTRNRFIGWYDPRIPDEDAASRPQTRMAA